MRQIDSINSLFFIYFVGFLFIISSLARTAQFTSSVVPVTGVAIQAEMLRTTSHQFLVGFT